MKSKALSFTAGFAFLALAWILPLQAQENAPAVGVRNVIILIADGAGYNHFAAAQMYLEGNLIAPTLQSFPVSLAVSTFPTGGGYDPDAAWRDPEYWKLGATDSAAAATALSCGVKTANGCLGVDAEGRPLRHLMESAESLGMATGVVTSVPFSHATPAGFIVHRGGRNDYAAIAEEMIDRSQADVIIGCGHPEYTNNGERRETPGFKYLGQPLWESIKAGTAGAEVDADHNGIQDDAWTFIEAREDFVKLAEGDAPKRLLGIARSISTLQQERKSVLANPADETPFETPLIQTVPTLAELARAALNVLDDDPEGFVLMIEGGAPDWASHDAQSGRMIEEMLGFNDAVNAVQKWVESRSNWRETLLVVTSDHETGGLTAQVEGMPNPSPAFAPISQGKGKLPRMQWTSGKHTNSLVPFFARGRGAERFEQSAGRRDPVRGPYLDNTDIPAAIRSLLPAPIPAAIAP
jgi:alkaline phosphatase